MMYIDQYRYMHTLGLSGCKIHRCRSYAIATITSDDMNIGLA